MNMHTLLASRPNVVVPRRDVTRRDALGVNGALLGVSKEAEDIFLHYALSFTVVYIYYFICRCFSHKPNCLLLLLLLPLLLLLLL